MEEVPRHGQRRGARASARTCRREKPPAPGPCSCMWRWDSWGCGRCLKNWERGPNRHRLAVAQLAGIIALGFALATEVHRGIQNRPAARLWNAPGLAVDSFRSDPQNAGGRSGRKRGARRSWPGSCWKPMSSWSRCGRAPAMSTAIFALTVEAVPCLGAGMRARRLAEPGQTDVCVHARRGPSAVFHQPATERSPLQGGA